MKREPLITLVVPVYNVCNYLHMCVDSVIGQSYRNIEILLVDDGSTDGSGEICDKYAESDYRVKVFHKNNGGLSSARNWGIENASGDYIAFIDGDDWISDKFVERLYNVMNEFKCDIVQCSHQDVLDGYLKEEMVSESFRESQVFSGREFSYASYNLIGWRAHLTTNKLYKKDLFQDIRFPEGKINEDEFTTYKVIWKAETVALISDKLYYYRRRVGSIMQQQYSKRRLDASEAFSERAEFYAQKNELELELLTNAYHLTWIAGQIKLINDIEVEDRDDIMEELERTRIELQKKVNERAWNENVVDAVFPFGQIEKNKTIILYGGGGIGQNYYKQIYEQNYSNVVLWVDRNMEICRGKGIPVQPINKIKSILDPWDYIVIAIADSNVVRSVIEMLMKEYEIPLKKIIY